MLITLLGSLVLWAFILFYAHKHPIRGVDSRLRGGGGDDGEGAEQGITGVGQQVYQAGKMTPQEQTQYQGSFDIGKLLQQIMQYQQGLGQQPQGYLDPTQQYLQQGGELGQALYGQTLQGVQDPYAQYESTLQPQLQLVEDYINRGAQQRGLLRSGIPIEQMGRAGVEIAIQQANERMNFRNQELNRAGSLSQYMTSQAGTNLANLANLYGQQQGYGQQAMGRQSGAGQAAGQYWAYPYTSQLSNIYANQGTLGRGIGTAGGALVGGALGGPMGAMVGAGAGGALGSSF